MSEIKGVWIITGTGLCILHRTYSQESNTIDQTLFAGFLTAIMAMAQEVTNSEIQKIDLKQIVLHFQYNSDNDYYIVVSAEKRIADDKINDFINDVKVYFENKLYPTIKSMFVPQLENIELFYPDIDDIVKKHFNLQKSFERETVSEKEVQHIVTIQKIKNILQKVEEGQLKTKEAAPQVMELYSQLSDEEKKQFSKTIEELERFIKKTDLIEKKQRKTLLDVSGKVKTYMKVEEWLSSF